MRKFLVELDSTKCRSYSFSNGQKYVAGRAKVVSEDALEPFRSAGVFLISDTVVGAPVAKKEETATLKAKPRSAAREVKNFEDKGEVASEDMADLATREEKAKTEVVEKEVSKEVTKPKGVVISSSLLKKS